MYTSSEAVLRKSPIQCLARNAKYCNILSGTEWSLTTKRTIYCITFALFIFIFLSYCSVISMNQFPNSGKTAFYPSIALLIPWPEYFITSPRHWHNSHWVFMFPPGTVDKQAEKKKSIISLGQNLADHYTPMPKANASLVLVALDYPTSQHMAHLD